MRSRRVLLAIGIVLIMCAAVAAWWFTRAPRAVPLEAGWEARVTTIAGDGVQGSRDGRRHAAQFLDPYGIAVAPDGQVYVADRYAVRRIPLSGEVTTFAGGARGFRDGAAHLAQFDTLSGLALDAAGAVYVADTGNDAVRRISADGAVSTIAGPTAGLRGPIGVAVHPQGRIFVADTYNDRIVEISSSGAVTLVAGSGTPGFADGPGAAASFDTPCGLAVDASGTLYVADLGNGVIRIISPGGEVATLPSGFGDAPSRPVDVAVGSGGGLFVTDDRGRVFEWQPPGAYRVVAGGRPGYTDGRGPEARFRNPTGVAVIGPGSLIVTDRRNAIVRELSAISQSGVRPPAPPLAPAFDADGFGRLPLLWPFEPLEGPFEITGTLGEPRGTVGSERLHAGLDVYAPENTPAHAVRAGVVDHPAAVADVGTINESLRIEGLTYIHLRIGRDHRERPTGDGRFVFTLDERGRATRVRVKRGARFETGDIVGTVNRFYHAHLNIGWPGEERNPLLFDLVNYEDTVPPVIVRGGIQLFAGDNSQVTKRERGRVVVDAPVRIVVDAWDQVDGNLPRRRLGLYRLGYQVVRPDGSGVDAFGPMRETLVFNGHIADQETARIVYAGGSGIPVYGSRRTRFLYLVTSTLRDGVGSDGMFDPAALAPGDYILRILAADFSGNEASANHDLPIRIERPVY